MELFLKNEYLSLSFDTLGGELRSIINKKNNREYLWQGNPDFWAGRSPNLFPIVGRVKEGKYKYDGNEYSIKSPHGFVRISELDISEIADNMIKFGLKSSEETLKAYPFEFDFFVSYTLTDNKITIKYYITNKSDKTMYFSVGAHPGFNIPINSNEKFEDYSITFADDCEPNEVLCKECFVTGNKKAFPLQNKHILPLRHNLFDNDAIIITDMASKSLTISSSKSQNSITVDFQDFDYLGIWHKPLSEAPYICIEPWNGLPSDINSDEQLTEKPAILTLETEEKYTAEYSITIE